VPGEASEVTYSGVQPDVDLRYTTSAAGVKEDIVLHSDAAGASHAFDVTGTDLALAEDGGVNLGGALGDQFSIPAPAVSVADGTDATVAAGAHYELSDPNGRAPGQRLTVAVDPGWLRSLPASAFPVVVDPTLWPLDPVSAVVFASPTATFPGPADVRLGRGSDGRVWRAGVRFNQYESYLNQGYRVYDAAVVFSPQAAEGSPVLDLGVYDQGGQPTSFSAIGTGKPLIDTAQDPDPYGSYVTADVTPVVDGWVTGGITGRWFGLRGTETGTLRRDYDVYMSLTVIKPPAPSYVTNLSDGQVLSTTTPTLQAQAVPAPESYVVEYEFQITTTPAPGTGMIVSYTPDQLTPTTWQVPAGTLQEGQTYYAWVLTDLNFYGNHVQPTRPDPVTARRKFTVDLGLGDGGPSPTDEVGAVPGQAASPSEGAPGPSLPASKVTVNLVDGNLSLTTGTKTLGTLSGGVALGFTYNSLATSAKGLRGEFYNDANSSGAIDAGDVLVGERTDPTVSFDWGPYAQPVAAQDPAKALARWSGFITLPTSGNWELGAISSDGLRATVDGTLRLDRWATHEPESAPVFGTPFSATAGTAVPIVIEWRNSGGVGVARVVLRDSFGDVYELSPSFLTRNANVLPHGWTFNANAAAASWVGLADRGTSVSVFAADGSAHEFTSAGNGAYTSPTTAPSDLLGLGDNGRFVLRDAAGSSYTFKATGVLESLVTAGDDRNPAALTYGYSGSPARLRTITDPVSNRSVTLSYGGDAPCAGSPAAAAGLLCHIAFWDSTATTLSYDSSGRFVRLTNPGPIVHDFAYDSTGRLTDIRDPMTVDAIAAGVRTDDATARTQIAYNASGQVASVTQPAPAAGAPRPQRTYTYNAANRTGEVDVAGFTPTVGYAQRTKYDTRNRIIESTDAAGLTTTFSWDALDRLLATTDPAGLRTTTEYDHASRPVRSYGPAPAASFQANGLPVVGATVPTSTKEFDGGIDGLAAAYWTNPSLAGGPSLHDTGLGDGGAMDKDWGTTPPVTPGAGGWSARYTGHHTIAATGPYLFQVNTKGSIAKVWIDDTLAVDHSQAEPSSGWATTTGAAVNLSAGPHRIRVDMVDTTGPAGLQVLAKPQASGSFTALPGSDLDPNYGLVTSTTDPDGKVTATEYTDAAAGIGAHYGLPTATVADPSGLNLRTTITYESPGPGSFLRRTGRTLPAGNSWTTTNYAGTEGPTAAVCGVSTGTPQGGQARRITGPDPDGAGPSSSRVEEFVYDAIGRPVGRREATLATLAGTGWECRTYDSRGRTATQTWPAHGAAAARTLTNTYAVGGNPLVNRVTDSAWGASSISATVDLLGRTVGYSDIWANTTTTAFDQAGRQTSTVGPVGTLTWNYSAATGRPTTTVRNGSTLSTASYDAAGRLNQATYGNGTSTQWGFDTYGRQTGIGITDNQGATGETRAHSLAGRVVDQQVFAGSGLVDAVTSGANYVYDGAGRLTQANLPGVTYNYGYGTAPGCPATAAGANTNRTSLSITGTGAGTTGSCYNQADQLTSTSAIPASQVVYDDHGNTIQLGDQALEFDSADRHVRTETPTHVTNYQRDPLDRIAERTDATRITHVASTTATSASTSASPALPGGTQTGDLIVAAVSARGLTAPSALTAAGWIVAANRTNGVGRTWVLTRYATATDPVSWTFTATGASHTTVSLSTYRNPNPTGVVAASATAVTTAASSHPVPSVTTTADAAHLVHVTGLVGAVNATAPAGTTQRARVNAPASLLVTDRYQNRAGTPPGASVTSGLVVSTASITIALTPLTNVTRYGYASHTDNSQFAKNTAGTVVETTIGLPGNTTAITTTTGAIYSHANQHGDTATTTSANTATIGNRISTGYTGPYGEAATVAPQNTDAPGTSFGWHGQQQRLTDRGLIHMGARPYTPAHGRFLAVDPIEGGCANDYTYAFGDPINSNDVSGRGAWDWVKKNILTCEDTAASRVLGALSYVPEIRLGAIWDPYDGGKASINATGLRGKGLAAFLAGSAITLNTKLLGRASAHAAVGAFAKTTGVLSAVGTAYTLSRSFVCS